MQTVLLFLFLVYFFLSQVPSSLASRPLRVAVHVRDRVTGDTLPVIVTSSQPPPLELQAGTTTFEDGASRPRIRTKSPKCEARPRNSRLQYAGRVTVSFANVPVDENVCCVVEITDALTSTLLSWYGWSAHACQLCDVSVRRCCLPIYEKNTMPLPTPKGSRPPTSQSVKEITQAGGVRCHATFNAPRAHATLNSYPPPSSFSSFSSSRTLPPSAASSKICIMQSQRPPGRRH